MTLWEVYQTHAVAYDRSRDKTLFERQWLARALADVPAGGAVLDLGCGAGDPIGHHVNKQGYAVTGLDFVPDMLGLYKKNVPGARTVLADMRTFSLKTRFDAIIGWGSFFHLSAQDQALCLPRLVTHLAPGGRLLLTVGPDAGEVWGQVQGQAVYHASLSPEDYADRLAVLGAPVETFVPEDPSCRGHSLLLARRA